MHLSRVRSYFHTWLQTRLFQHKLLTTSFFALTKRSSYRISRQPQCPIHTRSPSVLHHYSYVFSTFSSLQISTSTYKASRFQVSVFLTFALYSFVIQVLPVDICVELLAVVSLLMSFFIKHHLYRFTALVLLLQTHPAPCTHYLVRLLSPA